MGHDIITRAPLTVWSLEYYKGERIIDEPVRQFDIAPVLHGLDGAEYPEARR